MKVIETRLYQCEKCLEKYGTEADAKDCEERPITEDKEVKIGDLVYILQGDGAGGQAKVTRVFVLDKHWGHYAWKRYWHTVAVTAELVGSVGSRMLTFDAYDPVRSK